MDTVFDLVGRTAVGWREGSTLFKFPDWKPLQGEKGLCEAARKGQLRFIGTFVPGERRIILLEIIEKKQDKIPAHVLERLRHLQREALRARRES